MNWNIIVYNNSRCRYLHPLLCSFFRSRFGQSIGGKLVVANLAWPNEWAILVGSFMATCGAGLQSLISAPRLLYAISKDNLVPALNPFSVLSPKGEPTRALMLTLGK